MAAVIEIAAEPAAAGAQLSAARSSHIGLWLALAAVIAGYVVPTEVYLTPQDGFGYTLGIVGGSMMLALLIYPLRKRMPSLAFIGSVKLWFRIHMVLGIVGPLAILYHSNFSLGATNSNVALVCMLIVSSSGLVGRYLYTRIHHGLYGRQATLRELAGDVESLRQHSGALKMLPGLMNEVEIAEQHIAAAGDDGDPAIVGGLAAAERNATPRTTGSECGGDGCDTLSRTARAGRAFCAGRERLCWFAADGRPSCR